MDWCSSPLPGVCLTVAPGNPATRTLRGVSRLTSSFQSTARSMSPRSQGALDPSRSRCRLSIGTRGWYTACESRMREVLHLVRSRSRPRRIGPPSSRLRPTYSLTYPNLSSRLRTRSQVDGDRLRSTLIASFKRSRDVARN